MRIEELHDASRGEVLRGEVCWPIYRPLPYLIQSMVTMEGDRPGDLPVHINESGDT